MFRAPILAIRPSPDKEFVKGYPGSPHIVEEGDHVEPAVQGIVYVQVGPICVSAEWLHVELCKLETLPGGGTQNTCSELIKQHSVEIGPSSDGGYHILNTKVFPFYIRIPNTIPPTVDLGEGAGIQYQLIAKIRAKDVEGLACVYESDAVPLPAIVVDNHDLHSTDATYSQTEMKHTSQDGALLIVGCGRDSYSPGDHIFVIAGIEARLSHSVTLCELGLSLREIITFNPEPELRAVTGLVPESVVDIGETRLPVDLVLYGGQQYRVEMSVTIPSDHKLMTLNTARHIKISYVLTMEAVMADEKSLTIDLPLSVSSCPIKESIKPALKFAALTLGPEPLPENLDDNAIFPISGLVPTPAATDVAPTLENSVAASHPAALREMSHIPYGIPNFIETRNSQLGIQPPLNRIERWFREQHDQRYFQYKLDSTWMYMGYTKELYCEARRYQAARLEDDERYYEYQEAWGKVDDATRFRHALLKGLNMNSKWWLKDRPAMIDIFNLPYFDTSGDLILYEENFLDEATNFWRTRPRWARRTGFRVKIESPFQPQLPSPLATDIGFRFMEYKSPRKPFRLPRLPPEIIILILEQALKGGLPLTIISSVPFLEKRRLSLFHQVWRTSSINARDTPKYASLIAEYTARMTLRVGKRFFPGWEQRIISLLAAFKRKGKGREKDISISIEVDLTGIFPTQKYLRCRSISARCPRSLPPSCLQHLRELALKNYRFHCFSDLVHLVWEIPSLQKLDCRDLSWDELRVTQPLSPRRQLSDTFVISAQGSASAAPLVALLTSVFQINSGKTTGMLNVSKVLVLIDLLRSLSSEKNSQDEMYMNWSFHRKGLSCEVRNGFISDMHSMRLTLERDPVGAHRDLQVSMIDLVLYSVGTSINWTELDRHASSLLPDVNQRLAMVFVDVETDTEPSKRRVNAMQNRISSQLPNLWTSGQIDLKRGNVVNAHIVGNGPSNVHSYT